MGRCAAVGHSALRLKWMVAFGLIKNRCQRNAISGLLGGRLASEFAGS